MAVRVAINGFGRIGRLVLRAAYEHKHSDIEVVGVNDLGPVATNAHLLQYDSIHGRFPGEVTSGDNWMDIGRGKIRVTAERDPAKLPWRELGVDVALECTGIFTKRDAAAKHLEAGAKKVIISAPAAGFSSAPRPARPPGGGRGTRAPAGSPRTAGRPARCAPAT